MAGASVPAWRRWGSTSPCWRRRRSPRWSPFAPEPSTPRAGRCTAGQAVSLPSHLLLPALVAWLGGMLLSVRVFEAIASRLPVPAPPRFGPLLRGTLSRSLKRRSWAFASGIVGVGLVIAFGMSLAMFSATYDAAKAADSKFVGRLRPSRHAQRPQPSSRIRPASPRSSRSRACPPRRRSFSSPRTRS